MTYGPDERFRPSVLFRPTLKFKKKSEAWVNGEWVAEYGDITAIGHTPDDAMRAFDKAFHLSPSEYEVAG